MRLKGRVAIITGAAQGIGKAIAQEFSKEGAAIAAIDQKLEVNQVCGHIRESGGTATAYVFDVTDKAAYRKCVEDTVSREKKIDILVNNAAVLFYGTLLEDKLENWQRTIAVNSRPCTGVAVHGALHGGTRLGKNRKHHFRGSHCDAWASGRLLCRQGRDHQFHQIAGGGPCPARDFGECDRTRLHPYSYVDRRRC